MLIETRGLTKVYRSDDVAFTALDGIDVDIDAGEKVAIMGPSGSGKSTFMNLIGCLDLPTSGTYRLEGRDVARLEQEELAAVRNRTMGFVFQGFNLLPRLSARANVELPLVYAGIPAEERRRRALAALSQVGLHDRGESLPARLSGGQQQRIAVARAVVNRPRVLLADEPTGNLDSATGREIMELFVELNRSFGITLVVVTHDPEVAEFLDKVIVFRDGRVSLQAPRRA